MKSTLRILLLGLLLAACQEKQSHQTSSIFGSATENAQTPDVYDLPQIQAAGTLIGVTLSGPNTYYEYRGQGFGLQFRLAEEFSRSIGAALQMEIAPDTAALIERLRSGQADFVCLSLHEGEPWPTRDDTPLLADAIRQWWNPDRIRQLAAQQKTMRSVRRARPVMQDRARGIVSAYDDLFIRHSQQLRWDWRLLAAQCYQESAFDPDARSWAGAEGLMQLMPATAASLGVPPDRIRDPETNISAACRYLKKLHALFSDIPAPTDRIAFTLAAYNGGYQHVRDAMALTTKHGADATRWSDVSPYVLRLAEPQFYTDPVVQHGYLRGTETEAYVRLIMQRWQDYRRLARGGNSSTPAPAKKSMKQGEYRSHVKSADEWVPTQTDTLAAEP